MLTYITLSILLNIPITNWFLVFETRFYQNFMIFLNHKILDLALPNLWFCSIEKSKISGKRLHLTGRICQGPALKFLKPLHNGYIIDTEGNAYFIFIYSLDPIIRNSKYIKNRNPVVRNLSSVHHVPQSCFHLLELQLQGLHYEKLFHHCFCHFLLLLHLNCSY